MTTSQPNSNDKYPSYPPLNDRYTIGKKLGRGCFSIVYKAIRKSDKYPVAIKVIEKKCLDQETSNLLQNELEILRVVSSHPGIASLLDSMESDTHMYFIIEYVDGGPLLERICSHGNFSENDARILLRPILLTLQFMSNLGCVHRDIKPENILVDDHSQTWPVKLTDFGLSAKTQPDELLYGTMGTPLFVAPEILKGRGYDCACDMWSLGVVLYLVLCGYPPFPYNSPKQLISSIVNAKYTFPENEWQHVSDNVKDMLRKMLEVDPKKRLTPTSALAHPWITMAQSTDVLMNAQLKSFNALRKLRAGVVAVRTTLDLKSIIDPTRRQNQSPVSQKDFAADVEKHRELLAKLNFHVDQSVTSLSPLAAGTSSNHAVRKSRRSLFLPVSFLDEDNNSENNKIQADRKISSSNDQQNGSSLYNDKADPQLIQSRAKAMVAQVSDNEIFATSSNPFVQIPAEPNSPVAEKSQKGLPLLNLDGLHIS